MTEHTHEDPGSSCQPPVGATLTVFTPRYVLSTGCVLGQPPLREHRGEREEYSRALLGQRDQSRAQKWRKNSVYPDPGRYRLCEGVDRPGLLASGGVSVGLTGDGLGEEPSQQRKTVQAQTPGAEGVEGVVCEKKGPRLGQAAPARGWGVSARERSLPGLGPRGPGMGPSKGRPLQEVKHRHPPCFHFLLLPKCVACELLFLFF